MAEYKATFVYQSQVSSQTQSVENSPQTVTQQADSFNTMGTILEYGSPIVLVGTLYQRYLEFVGGVLTGGIPSAADIANNPALQCSIIEMASLFSCSKVPSCPHPKTLIAGNNTGELKCGCPDEDSRDARQPSLDALVSAAPKCIRDLRQKAWDDCFRSVLDALNRLKIYRGVAMPWGAAIDLAMTAIRNISNDSTLLPAEKQWQIQKILDDLSINMQQQNNNVLPYGVFQALNNLQAGTRACADNITNNCSLMNVPDRDSIDTVLKTMSNKSEKKCGSFSKTTENGVSKSGKVLSDACDCICPSGVPCPDTDYCIDCSEMGGTVKYHAGGGGLLGEALFPPYCTCECIEGQRRYNTDGGLSPCVPECPEGQSFIAMPCSDDRVYWVKDSICYGCACAKKSGSWPWSPTVAVTDSYCNEILKNGIVDRNNKCECICPPGYTQISSPVWEGEQIKCLPPCPEGSKRDYYSEDCVCNKTMNCPPLSIQSTSDPCSCECFNPKKQYNKYNNSCDCKTSFDVVPWGACDQTTSLELDANCECICPKGKCKNGSIAIAKRNPDKCECICMNSCPDGQVKTPDCDCVIASGSYTSFVSVDSNILQQYHVIETL